ncbi:MAG TPA: RsmE family RNA methyltransferase [Polyangiaceae bacterium]|nr:RsmE family RNA methyltransferase [Polyangiaceae bacterium]
MSPRPLRVPVAGLRPGPFALPPEAARYVGTVHRLGPGAALVLVDHAARLEAPARVVSAERGAVVVEAEAPAPSASLPPLAIVLLQALPKGDKMDAIVRDATELGVARVVPVFAARSVVRPGAGGGGRLERWRRVALEAARQCGRGDVPEVLEPVSPEGAFRLAPAEGPRLVLEPGAPPLRDAFGPETPPALALAVGPEGGWAPSELDAARAGGWAPASLGPFVLRTETAAAAALGALWALARR